MTLIGCNGAQDSSQFAQEPRYELIVPADVPAERAAAGKDGNSTVVNAKLEYAELHRSGWNDCVRDMTSPVDPFRFTDDFDQPFPQFNSDQARAHDDGYNQCKRAFQALGCDVNGLAELPRHSCAH